MKVILSLIAVAALSAVTSVFAQDEETPSPSPSPEEKASATVEAPAATATPEESKASKKEETSASTKTESSTTAEKSAAETKKETSSATTATKSGATTTTKSAAPAAISTTVRKGMSTEATLREMENKWEAAYAAHDPSVAQAYVASDFVGVSPRFKFTNKSTLLSDFKKDKDTYQSTKNESLKVTTFGPNVAVVTGRAREKGTGKDGKAFDRTYYFTDTWMQRANQWQCIASQASEMRK